MDDGAFIALLSMPIVLGLVVGGLIFLFGVIAAANLVVAQALSRAGSRRLSRRRERRDLISMDDAAAGSEVQTVLERD